MRERYIKKKKTPSNYSNTNLPAVILFQAVLSNINSFQNSLFDPEIGP